MEPIIIVRIDWKRLRQWIFFRIIWLLYFAYDTAQDDFGPLAGNAYAFTAAVASIGTLFAGVGAWYTWQLAGPATGICLFLAAYTLLGLLCSFLLRVSGCTDRMLPHV